MIKEIYIGPYIFYLTARDFFNAAKIVSTIDFEKRINLPAYFLYCKSLELAMKSILLTFKEHTLEYLRDERNFGHDLSKGLNLLEKKDPNKNIIRLSEKDKKIINNLNEWYKRKEKKFEYPIFTQIKNYPELPPLKDVENIFNNFLNSRILKLM